MRLTKLNQLEVNHLPAQRSLLRDGLHPLHAVDNLVEVADGVQAGQLPARLRLPVRQLNNALSCHAFLIQDKIVNELDSDPGLVLAPSLGSKFRIKSVAPVFFSSSFPTFKKM